MNIGVVFPQTDIGNDPVAIRDYAQAVEAMDYTHILAYDHVLGANRERYRDLTGFIDGTKNPSLLEAPDVALVPEGAPGAGGVWLGGVSFWTIAITPR